MIKDAKIVLTGGAGFIGSNLCRSLNEAGYKNIVLVDDLTDISKLDNLKGLEFCFVPSNDFWSDINSYVAGANFVFHLGAISSTAEMDMNKLIEENYKKTIALIGLCAKRKIPIHYASSASVYGNKKDGTYEPLNPYAWSKMFVDQKVSQTQKQFGTYDNVVGLRYFNCYDEKTEVLTKKGFKFLKDISFDDEVATLNKETKVVEYHKPLFIHKNKYKGQLYHFKSRRIDILTTPEQKLFLKTKKDTYSLVCAEDVVNDNLYSAKTSVIGKWQGGTEEYEIIPSCKLNDGRQRVEHLEKKIPIRSWLKFLGWFLSEGSVFKGETKSGEFYRVNISQIEKQEWIDEIYNLAIEIGFSPQKTFKNKGKIPTGITIHSKQLFLHLEKFKKEKFIPREILNLSPSLLLCLFETLMKGDGHKDGSKYTTKFFNFASQFQELLLKIGKLGTISSEVDKKGRIIYRIRICKCVEPQIGNNEKKKVNFSTVQWDDFVYDITVPNHIFFARRNGKIYWTGNCYGPGEYHKVNQCSPILHFWNQTVQSKDKKIKVFNVEAKRDFIYVNDVCDVHIWLMENKPDLYGIFDLGTGKNYSFLHLAEVCNKYLTSLYVEAPEFGIEKIPFPKHLLGRYQFNTKANMTWLKNLGYNKKFTSLDRGIKYYLEHLRQKLLLETPL